MKVLAVDPGREKCGVAVCDADGVVAHRVVAIGDLYRVSKTWVEIYQVGAVIVGDRTGYKQTFDILRPIGLEIEGVPEHGSTLLARKRYFQDHPPKGWRRLLPRSLLVPGEPYDDYAAVVLAEAYLAARNP
jgi:RNase H-fold protein (predicted Holliday junction resolvase)